MPNNPSCIPRFLAYQITSLWKSIEIWDGERAFQVVHTVIKIMWTPDRRGKIAEMPEVVSARIFQGEDHHISFDNQFLCRLIPDKEHCTLWLSETELWMVAYSGIQLVKWNIHFIFQNTDCKCAQCLLGGIKEDKLLGEADFASFFSLVSMLSEPKLFFPFSPIWEHFKKINTDLPF